MVISLEIARTSVQNEARKGADVMCWNGEFMIEGKGLEGWAVFGH